MDRALIVGINTYTTQPLQGCCNDAEDMRRLLVDRYGFDDDFIVLLSEGDAVKNAIVSELERLVNYLDPSDRMVFFFSGHGTQVPQGDRVGEAICPVDFERSKPETSVHDHELIRIFRQVPPSVELLWISDSCYSGGLAKSGRDVERRAKAMEPAEDIRAEMARLLARNPEVARLGRATEDLHVALLAACAATESAWETRFEGRSNGAFTHYLIEALGAAPTTSPEHLCPDLVHRLARGGFRQTPVLEGDPAIRKRAFLAHPT